VFFGGSVVADCAILGDLGAMLMSTKMQSTIGCVRAGCAFAGLVGALLWGERAWAVAWQVPPPVPPSAPFATAEVVNVACGPVPPCGGGAMDLSEVFDLVPDFMTPAGRFQFGNAADAYAADGSPPMGYFAEGNGVAFLTLDGFGTSRMQVRWASDTLLNSEGDISFFTGHARSDVAATPYFALAGLVIGQVYTIGYSWALDADAVADHELAMEDPENAHGMARLRIPSAAVTESLFDVAVDSDDPTLLSAIYTSAMGAVSFVAADSSVFVYVDVTSHSEAMFNMPGKPPPSGVDDLAGAHFFAELNLSVVSEPASVWLALAAVVVAAGIRRRRNRASW
jgi:MYXO-CTERM domain-containing protein